MVRVIALALLSFYTLSAQDGASANLLYHRVWAVVPMIGNGKPDDPRRPMFVPSPGDKKKANPKERPAILSYSMQISDDGKEALVEFVGVNPAALRFIAESKDPRVKAFERGKATKAEIEVEFQKHKHNFKLESLGGRAK